MTTSEFLKLFSLKSGISYDDIYDRGLSEGWLDSEDITFKDRPISRKNVARICHLYLQKVIGLKDLDINGAKELRDLYDCRVCANNIAQVYMRGIMEAKKLMKDKPFLWFDLNGEDDDRTIELILVRLFELQ